MAKKIQLERMWVGGGVVGSEQNKRWQTFKGIQLPKHRIKAILKENHNQGNENNTD